MIDDVEQLGMIAIVLLRLLYLVFRQGIGLVLLMGRTASIKGRRVPRAAPRQIRVSRFIPGSTPRSRSVQGAFTQRTRASCAVGKY
jgi:hypothetical protein